MKASFMTCLLVVVSLYITIIIFFLTTHVLHIAGIPQCHWHGQHDEFDCIVIDLLGPNLNQLKEVTTKLPVDVVIDFGCQMVSILKHINN